MIGTDAELLMMARRQEALRDGDLRLSDWETAFIADVCGIHPRDLTDRQAAWVSRIVWLHRAMLDPELVPAREPPAPPPRTPQQNRRNYR